MSKTSFRVITLLFFVRGFLGGFLGASLLRQKITIKKYQEMEVSFDNERDSLTTRIDSLDWEVTKMSIDIGRYEIIMDRVWALDSPLVEKITKNLE